MCGIGGFWSRSADRSAEQLREVADGMAAAVRHRGPDAGGAWVDPASGLAFGHRRLAVLDLTPAGAQPMRSADDRYVLSFNGEIYNAPLLRARLEAQGCSFRGTSDTEVLLALVARSGVRAALDEADGMFALSVWDRHERSLTLARDRMGEKPLYVGWHGGTLLFASEVSSLRAFPGFRAEVDPDAVASLLRYSCIPAPASIYRGIAKLPAGHLLTLDERTPPGALPWSPYWDLAAVAARGAVTSAGIDERAALEELDRLLGDSVQAQMLSDVPLGCFLSGGIDSSLVAALAQERTGRPLRTFTIGFENAGWDEAPHARAVARHLGTDHVEQYVSDADALAVVPTLGEVYSEPFADSSQIPTLLVSRLAREHVTVALTGDGGDELFAGYDRYRVHGRMSSLFSVVPPAPRRAVASLVLGVSTDRWDSLSRALRPVLPSRAAVSRPGEKLHKAARLLRHQSTVDLYDALMSAWVDPAAALRAAGGAGRVPPLRLSGGDVVRQLQLLDQSRYLPDDLLTKVDRAAMSVSLETRVPLLSRAVVEHAWTLPTRMLIANGRGKQPLRQLLQRRVPPHLYDRPKQGFGVPLAAWLRGPLRSWAQDLLAPSALAEDDLLEAGVVRAVLEEHLSGRADHSTRLWPVLVLQSWRAAQPVGVG